MHVRYSAIKLYGAIYTCMHASQLPNRNLQCELAITLLISECNTIFLSHCIDRLHGDGPLKCMPAVTAQPLKFE